MSEIARYNHAFDFAFEVVSAKKDASDVTPSMLREALVLRVNSLPDWEILQACNHFDTHKE